MAKDRSESEKREKKDKKQKLSETNGIAKDKSPEKDEKKKRKEEKKRLKEAAGKAVEAGEATPAAALLKTLGKDKPKAKAAAVENSDEDETAAGKDEAKDDVKKELLLGASVPFANPMADDKTMRRVLRGVKKAAKQKALRRGVKEVVKSLRKSAPNPSGPAQAVVVLAADISPFDVISHLPVLCEDHHVPYIYVPSRAELGAAGSTKRPTSVVMVVPTVPPKRKAELEKEGKGDKEDWSETYADLVKVVEKAGKGVRI